LRSAERDDLRVEAMEHKGNLASNSLARTGDQRTATFEVNLLSGGDGFQRRKRLQQNEKLYSRNGRVVDWESDPF
jgi:hypothetical protein